ncbi:MAG TPA: hypothetical protein VLH75_03590 [Longimicrobiales bacterium]|nr:hypothetical protein [Longimicrobiales bacterium]
MRLTRSALLLALPLALSLAPSPARAQVFGQPSPTGSSRGWAPGWAGIRAGWDYNAQAAVLGAQLRLPAIPSGHAELVPNGDVTFLDGLREYQAGVDAVVVSGGRHGGVYGGVGMAWRSTVWEEGGPRETRSAPVTVVGVRSGTLGGAPFGTQLEMRWIWLDGPFRPRVLTLGINFPLWGGGRSR